MITPEDKETLINALKTYYTSLMVLNNLYEKHPELNNIQPHSFQDCITTSLDDAALRVQSAYEDYCETLCIDSTPPNHWNLNLVEHRTPTITTIDEEDITLED